MWLLLQNLYEGEAQRFLGTTPLSLVISPTFRKDEGRLSQGKLEAVEAVPESGQSPRETGYRMPSKGQINK